MPEKRERFYRGSVFTTLNDLKLRCEGDESDLSFALTNLELGNQNGNDGTIGTFQETDDYDGLGYLIIREYQDEADANSIETTLGIQGNTHLFRGKASIGAEVKHITVFRENH